MIKDKVEAVLEIGVDKGGSILLWERYFPNAKIYGVDISSVPEDLKNSERIVLFPKTNAYDTTFIENIKDIKFDIIIDDGSHNLEDIKFVIQHYAPLLAKGGCLYIEDIKNTSWIEELVALKINNFSIDICAYDLRQKTGHEDSILLCINYYQFSENEQQQINKIKSMFQIQ
jgi:cephalosporin hydroxylase